MTDDGSLEHDAGLTLDEPGEGRLDGDSYRAHGQPSIRKLGSDGLTYPLGFIYVSTNPANGHAVGGMLVADNTGVPLEFMVTTAVRPTRAQQILYGNRLKSFVAVNLCAKELVQQIKTKPSVIFVQEAWMLSLSEHTTIPVLQILRTEQLGTASSRPTIIPPRNHQEYSQAIDLTSLDVDMLDAFERIEKCREVLAAKSEEYRI